MEQADQFSLSRPKPTDLPGFLPFACGQLEAPFHLRVLIETVEVYGSKSAVDMKGGKSIREKTTPQGQTSATHTSAERDVSAVVQEPGDEGDVVMRARCDVLGRPVELMFYRCAEVPRLLMKIIGLCIPYHEQLIKITIRGVPLDGAVIYEIAKFLPSSQLTEICLDDSPVTHRNYHLLLERATRLRSLSLARCDLRDEDCELLAAHLTYPQPASRCLALLALQANRISDEGARALGSALRTNRTLRYLNLAGNAIGNEGAAHILSSLAQFPVSREEILTKQRRTFDYLKLKQDAYTRCYRELMQQSVESPADSARGRRRTVLGRTRRGSTSTLASLKSSGLDALAGRVEAMVWELVGTPCEPLEASELVTRGDEVYCAGNFSLSYLNLAYNELDCTSAKRLAAVLAYQEGARRVGLLRAVLEGNPIETACEGARAASELLARVASEQPVVLQSKPGRKSERAKFKGN